MSKTTSPATPALYVATKPITLNGRIYQPGDGVDVSDINPRRIQQLVERRQLGSNTQGVAITVRTASKAAAPVERRQAPAAAVTAPEGLHVKHFGRSRWAVANADGKAITDYMAKAEAEEALAKMQPPVAEGGPVAPQPGAPGEPAAATTPETAQDAPSGSDKGGEGPSGSQPEGDAQTADAAQP